MRSGLWFEWKCLYVFKGFRQCFFEFISELEFFLFRECRVQADVTVLAYGTLKVIFFSFCIVMCTVNLFHGKYSTAKPILNKHTVRQVSSPINLKPCSCSRRPSPALHTTGVYHYLGPNVLRCCQLAKPIDLRLLIPAHSIKLI